MMNKLYVSTLSNMCKKVHEMQDALTKAERLQSAVKEKRILEAHKKYKKMLKKITNKNKHLTVK